MKTVMGVDSSLACTGLGLVDYETGMGVAATSVIPNPKWELDEKLLFIVKSTLDYVDKYDVVDVWIEEPIVYRSRRTSIRLGMVYGVLRVALYERLGVPCGDAPITTVKKWATGHGGASKVGMRGAAYTRLGVWAQNDNEADALLIAAWGRERFVSAVEDDTI